MAKGIAGQTIRYTRIVMGEGELEEGQTPRNMTGVARPVVSLDISRCKALGDGKVCVGGVFRNTQIQEGFYYRELGLYAEDPDPNVGEVLYCYANAGELAEYILPGGGANVLEKSIDIITTIGEAAHVTAYIPTDAGASREELEAAQRLAQEAMDRAQEGEAMASEALRVAQQAMLDVRELSKQLAKNTSKIETLWDAVFSDLTANPFQVSFADLSGITLGYGVWNRALARLEC